MQEEKILKEILAGRRMNEEELIALYKGASLLNIAKAANIIRQRRFPENTMTFIIDRNINYTNICSCQCSFCAFYRKVEDNDAYVISQDLIVDKIEEAIALGASQVMIQGGLNKDLSIEYFEDMFKGIKAKFDITIHSLSAPEIKFIAENSNLSISDTLLRLKKAGLDSLPGGGAEILHDNIRNTISPKKINSAEWLDVMRSAHQIGMKSTATMMMGTVEEIEHRAIHLQQIRDLQDETGGFRAFIAWTYQAGNNELKGKKINSVEYLKLLALSRLYLDNIDHIQASWVTQGKELAQLSLHFGANDLGSIMIEENVVRSTGLNYKMKKAEMIDLIKGAGFTPALRDTTYIILE